MYRVFGRLLLEGRSLRATYYLFKHCLTVVLLSSLWLVCSDMAISMNLLFIASHTNQFDFFPSDKMETTNQKAWPISSYICVIRFEKKLLISDWNKKRGCPHRGCKNRAEIGIWSHTKMLIYKQCTHNHLPVCKFAVYTIYEQVMRNTRADKLTTTHWKSNFSDIPDVIRFLPHCGGFLRLRMLYI